MKSMLCRIGACAVILVIAGTAVIAKDWRGIIPLKSTRKDVERVGGLAGLIIRFPQKDR